ncbi:proteophosphoglycan ppg4 [Strigomonas culicis]|uniref:Proteophosphoglycan ppg4 n=1 Tax=Strigomonas culicis TaxID=28005 RepID=S9TPI6_9TRYP|nr:proteophosphoglycan ppg4 [Strigomonas culicis]|eukprot:EPY18368.1 proteophosphoglycan ppg4 [Strigomonas culicis]
MALCRIHEVADFAKSRNESHLTESSQGISSVDSGSFSTRSSSTVVAVPAWREELPPAPHSEWLRPLARGRTEGTKQPSGPLDADGAGAAAKSPIPLPVGALTPAKAEALRQERLSLVADGSAAPALPSCPKRSVPALRSGDVPLSSPVAGGGDAMSSQASGKASATGPVAVSLSGPFCTNSPLPPIGEAVPPLHQRSEGSAREDTDTAIRGAVNDAALTSNRAPRSDSIISATEESEPTTSARGESAAKGGVPPVLTAEAEYRFLADEPAHALPVYTDAKRGSMDFTDVRDGGAMRHRLSVNELNPQGTVPLTLTLFNHMSNAHEGLCGQEGERSVSESAMYGSASNSSSSDPPPTGIASGRDRTHGEGEGRRGVDMEEYASMKWTSSFCFDALGAERRRRSQTLNPGALHAIAEGRDPGQQADETTHYPVFHSHTQLDTSGPILYASSSFMFCGAGDEDAMEYPMFYPSFTEAEETGQDKEGKIERSRRSSMDCSSSDGEEAHEEGGGKVVFFSVVDGLRGADSLLRHFCSMRVDPTPRHSGRGVNSVVPHSQSDDIRYRSW